MEKTRNAYLIGKQTFNNDGSAVPAQSKELRKILKDVKVGKGTPIIKAFIRGFVNAQMLQK